MEIENSIQTILTPVKQIENPTSKIIRGIDAARAASIYSDSKSLGGRRVGAALFAGSRLLTIGFNLYGKSRPTNMCVKNGKHFCKSTHAEQAALLKYNRHHTNHNSTSKLTLFVVRFTHQNNTGCSKPCDMCQKLLQEFGIDEVIYFNSDGLIEISKVKKL